MKPPTLLSVLATLVLAAAVCAQERDQRPDEAHRLMEKAREAKAAGRDDEARELLSQAHRQWDKWGESDSKKPEGADRGDHFAHLKQKIEDLRRAGKHEEAERLERKVNEFRSQHERVDVHHGGPGEERLHHVMEAVRHLRAAGMNEVAENLEHHARRMREEIEQHAGKEHGAPSAAPGELRQLREQVERLSHEFQKLRDEMKRQPSSSPQKE